MPAPKYYCDYCDKAFADSPAARRRHLQSTYHQSTKKAWFDSFKDPAELLAENPNRGVCAQFIRTGLCQYGFKCKYVHPARPSQESSVASAYRSRFRDDHTKSYLSQSDLPPSLLPPPEEGYPPLPALDWG